MATPTEKEKMLRSELYDPRDATLTADRHTARELLRQYNSLTLAESPEAAELLSKLLGAVGKGCFVEMPLRCDYGYNIRMGDNVYMNFNCVLLDGCEIRIGDRVMFGPNVQLYTPCHPLDPKQRATGAEFEKPITIEDDVWIGGNTIVVPGVTVGRGSVIGAGSVVTKNVPAMCVYAGNPARFIKKIETEEEKASKAADSSAKQS